MTEVLHAQGKPRDTITWTPRAHVDKWSPDQVAYAMRRLKITRDPTHDELLEQIGMPDDVIDEIGNILVTAGLDRLTKLFIASGTPQALTNTSGRIGVGNSATAAVVGQTDLQAAAGSANRFFMTMASTYPQQANGVITAQSIFGTADGNFSWAEWCLDIGSPTVVSGTTVNACMVNRAVQALGTKVAGAVWTFTVTVTIA